MKSYIYGCIAAGLGACMSTANAAAIQFDSTFNGTGVASINTLGTADDQARAIAIDGSGNIVVAGSTGTATGGAFLLSRFTDDGTLDSTFGTGGVVTDNFSKGSGDNAYGLAIDSSGRLIVAGAINGAFQQSDVGLARYLPDGTLDTSFGTGGHVETNTDGSDENVIESAYDLAVDGSGNIITVGRAGTLSGFSLSNSILVERYDSAGNLDTTFNSTGILLGEDGFGRAVAIDGNNKIVVAGYTSNAVGSSLIVERYNDDGTFDPTFNGGSAVIDNFGDKTQTYGLAIDASNRIVVVGSLGLGSGAQFLAARYNNDGSADTSFNGSGHVAITVSSGADVAYDVAIDVSGHILIAGSAGGNTGLVRLNESDGNPDTGFDDDGIASLDITMTSQQDVGYAVTMDGNDRILVGGRIFATSTHYDMAVARLSLPGVQFNAPTYSASESTASATITVSRSGSPSGAISVDYASSDGTASSGSDYTAAGGTLNWSDGDTADKTFAIAISDDALDEDDETVELTLSNATGTSLGIQNTAVLTIMDDDPPPSLSISDASAAEGDAGTQQFGFTVTLDAASSRTVTIDYATGDVSASAGTDYTAASGTLTFTPGQTSQTVEVTVIGDTSVEADEDFNVTLSNPVNASIADATGTGTIMNDDVDVHILSYSAGPNGSLTGSASQQVADGDDGTPVTAVPDPGYGFVQWSDSRTDNPRTDTNVTADISVSASFANAAISLTKTVTAGDPYAAVGDVIAYSLQAENTGGANLTGVTISDPSATQIDCAPTLPELSPGGTYSCEASHTVSQADLEAGSFTNTATATSNETGPVSDSATATAVPPITDFSVLSATNTGMITGSISGGGPGCSVGAASATTPEAVAGNGPSGAEFPHGLLDLRLEACTPGATVMVVVDFPVTLPPGTEYFKYGPTLDNTTPHWYVLPATVAGATVSYSLTDGGLGDDDLTADGAILDPAGPGAASGESPAAIPVMPRWALAILALLLAGLGARHTVVTLDSTRR